MKNVSGNVSWLDNFHKDQPLTIQQMTPVIDGIHNLMREHKWTHISDVLNMLDERSSIESIVTCLRTTFSVRGKISSWNHTLENARKWISEKGGNLEILKGL